MAPITTSPHLLFPVPPPPISSTSCKCSRSVPAFSSSQASPPTLVCFSQAALTTATTIARRRGRTGWRSRQTRISGMQDSRFIAEELRKRERCIAAESNSEGTSVATSEPLSSEDDEDSVYVEQILKVLDILKTTRDMTFNEVKLTIVIEDPREVERRRQLGIEDERGCSRDDMANALVDVYEGRIPKDRAVLRELAKEMTAWPRLEDDGPLERSGPKQSLYAKVTDIGVDPAVAAQRARVDWDAAAEINPGEGDKDLGETLPPVVGFSLLYLVSVLPIAIGIVVVLILFVNSLQ